MSSSSETGHYKNVVNLKSLATFATNLGANYTPQKAILQLPYINTLVEEATILHNKVKDQANTTAITINNRQVIFEPVKPLATKIINTMGSTDVNPKTIEDAKTINAKIQGTRIKKIVLKDNEEVNDKTVSVSRQSYDSIYENFRSLRDLAEQDGGYNPNETEVKIATLTTIENEMLAANENVENENNILGNRRVDRDKRFYKDTDGLLEVARAFKKYIRGKYGITSPQFAQISQLQFKDLGIK